MEAKIDYNGKKYGVSYSRTKYLDGNHEEKELHELRFGRNVFKGKSLDDVINKFRKFLE